MRNLEPALKLITEFEGIFLKPYLCPAKIPTIGVGSTVYPDGRPVEMTDPAITKEEAMEFLRHHLQKDCDKLESFLTKNKIKLNDNQFCAILSFAYNCGLGPVVTPGRSLHDALKSGSPSKVVEALMLFTRAAVNGKRVVLNGLVRRRKAESALYSK
jgi:lysozyme